MKIQKRTIGTLPVRSLPSKKNTVCPSCLKKGQFKTDNNLETYCTNCGLVIDSPYPYSAGNRYDLLCDFIFKAKLCELNKKWKKKKK